MSFEEYVAARLPALLRYAVLLTGDPHLAEDLGRPSRYSERDGRTSLHVYGVQGMHISVNAATDGRPELDRATVERIVRGLRLVDSPDRPADWTDRPLP